MHGTRPGATPDFFRVDGLLTDAERDLRDRVRHFAEQRLRPVARAAWEREEFPAQLLPELATLGIAADGSDNSPAPGHVGSGLVLQELARVDSSFATFIDVQIGLVMGALAACGSEEQRERWLPRLARFEALGAFALTEPGHGSDASHLTTRAVRDGDADYYLLDGAKRWIGNGAACDVAVVWAQAEDGVAGFLVEPPCAGYLAAPIAGKLSQRGLHQADIQLTGCRVPAANRLPRGGFSAVAGVLGPSRYGVAWHALGEALACYEAALSYAKSREQFGRPIAGFQLTQAKLVRMLGEITKIQLLLVQLGRLLERDEATPGMVAYAKLSATVAAREVAATAREILGGNGILQDHDVMRHLCDIEAVYTFEGTSDVNTLIVGREITGISAFS